MSQTNKGLEISPLAIKHDNTTSLWLLPFPNLLRFWYLSIRKRQLKARKVLQGKSALVAMPLFRQEREPVPDL